MYGVGESEDGKALVKRKYSGRQKAMLVIVLLSNFTAYACYSLMAPFFPNEMVSKGGTATIAAAVLSSYNFVIFVSSPLFGGIVTRVGLKRLLNIGTFVLATSTFAFAFVVYLPLTYFIIASFALRIIEGAGLAAYAAAMFATVVKEFPDDVALNMGLADMALGIGMTVGPLFGGVLFEAGGFPLPFIVFGLLFYVLNVFMYCIHPEDDGAEISTHGSYFSLLRIPRILLDNLIVAACTFNIGFYESVVSLHIAPLVAGSPLGTGAVMLAVGLFTGIASPLWGRTVDRGLMHPHVTMTIGSLMAGTAFLLMGPAPFLHLKTTLWIVVVGASINGFGNGALFTSPFYDSVFTTEQLGMEQNTAMFGRISGLFMSSFAFGAFVGPLFAGPLTDMYGFPSAAISVSALQFACALMCLVFFLKDRSKGK